MSGDPRVSVIMPARGEGPLITGVLDRLFESIRLSCEVLVIVDSADDPTAEVIERYADSEPRLGCLTNTYGAGPANAIRFGMDAARAEVIVVTMADGCDDSRQIDDLARLVERGVAVAAASRYMAGGQQVGGLNTLAQGLADSVNNVLKAYSTAYARSVGIDSRHGFEIGIELTAKARRLRLPVAEIPTIWLDRPTGVSNFKIIRWMPRYLRWYRFSFGPRLTVGQVRKRCSRVAAGRAARRAARHAAGAAGAAAREAAEEG